MSNRIYLLDANALIASSVDDHALYARAHGMASEAAAAIRDVPHNARRANPVSLPVAGRKLDRYTKGGLALDRFTIGTCLLAGRRFLSRPT
ncbi:MAG: hypothetical protein ACKV2U_30540 [Bryobacteraceae bacterium]